MSRSINKDTDWKREWEEEQILTPEEQEQADRDRAEIDQIYFDLLMAELDLEEEENYRVYVEANSDPFDDYYDDYESDGYAFWEEYHAREDEYAGQATMREAAMESQGSTGCPAGSNEERSGPDKQGTQSPPR